MAEEVAARERILREAAALFRMQGFNGTSVRDLAQAVGVTKSSLYHHFPSKQALLAEILETTVDRTTPAVRAIAGSGVSASEKVRQAVAQHIVELVADRDNVACFIEEGRFLAPAYLNTYIAKRDRYEQYFRQIVEDGISSGEFRPVSVRLATLALLGMCNWVVRWYRPDGEFSTEEIASQFGQLAVGGLASGDRAPAPAIAGGGGSP